MDWPELVPLILFGALVVLLGALRLARGRYAAPGYLGYLAAFVGVLLVAHWWSEIAAISILGLLSFHALREYFSLVDLRLGDRWGVIGAYLSIPFMFWLVAIEWYGFFIVSIPVYAFVVVPFLVALGDTEGKGSVLSIGAIDFGLFFFVYCIGHIAYLASHAVGMTLVLVVAVAACQGLAIATRAYGRPVGLIASWAVVTALLLLTREQTTIPQGQVWILGALIPVCAHMGDFTVRVLEHDLGVNDDDLVPGRGRVLDSLKAYLFAAPIAVHYLRWSMGFGD